MEDKVKVVFEKAHKDYTVGQVETFEGRGNVTLANWFIANGIASVYDAKAKKTGCAGCDEKINETIEQLNATIIERDSTIEQLNATIEELKLKKGKKPTEKTEETTD